MADLTPNPGDVQPGWLGVVLTGILVFLVKPLGISVAKAVGRAFSRVGLQIEVGQTRQERTELEQDVRERDALILALTSDSAMLKERVAGLTRDVQERDQRIARLEREVAVLRRENLQLRQQRQGGGANPPRGVPE